MIDTLRILESVEQFYSRSFDKLIIITIAIITCVGVIVPILVTLYQQRLFRIESERIAKYIENNLEKQINTAVEEIRDEYNQKDAEYRKLISISEKSFEKKIAHSEGGNYQIQGLMILEAGDPLTAFDCFIKAAINQINSEDELNLRRVLTMICDECLPKLSKNDLEKHDFIIENYKKLLSTLELANINNRYHDDLALLKSSFKETSNR